MVKWYSQNTLHHSQIKQSSESSMFLNINFTLLFFSHPVLEKRIF